MTDGRYYDEKFTVESAAVGPYGVQVKGPITINVHRKSQCTGRHCCIHNPSNHPLKDAPMNWRADKGIMERICEHGIGHDDPDDVAFQKSIFKGPFEHMKYIGSHGCDGCCS